MSPLLEIRHPTVEELALLEERKKKSVKRKGPREEFLDTFKRVRLMLQSNGSATLVYSINERDLANRDANRLRNQLVGAGYSVDLGIEDTEHKNTKLIIAVSGE